MPQSFRRYWTVPSPMPRALAAAIIRCCASSVRSPLYSPESMLIPYSDIGSGGSGGSPVPPGSDATTRRIGRPYLVANSKSRSSCAGTAMMAPVP